MSRYEQIKKIAETGVPAEVEGFQVQVDLAKEYIQVMDEAMRSNNTKFFEVEKSVPVAAAVVGCRMVLMKRK